MGLNKFVFMFSLSLITLAWSQESKLPILATKQSVRNLRFISHDGLFSYYQRSSGELMLSTNYDVKSVLTSAAGTQYELIGSPERKKILATQDEYYNRFFSQRYLKKISVIDYGKTTATTIGNGIAPRLHRKDTWASFYDSFKRTIYFHSLNNQAIDFQIKLANIHSPYFIPEIIMLDDKNVLYTDLNNQGLQGILLFEKDKQKSSVLLKSVDPANMIELCQHQETLFIMERGLTSATQGTRILSVSGTGLDLTKFSLVYESELNDLGHLECAIDPQNLYFIKNTSIKNKKETYDVFSLNLATKLLSQLSDLGDVAQFINMDGKLMIPYHDRFYLLIGESDILKKDLLKK